MRIASAIITLSVAALPVLAQDLPGVCGELANPAVGSWASYTLTVPQMGGSFAMRLAVVNSEESAGSTMFWHEMKLDTPQGEMIIQVLVPSFPYGSSDVSRMVMKAPGQPAMELPSSMMAMIEQQGGRNFASEILKGCASAEKIGDESVTVAAGSFETEHYRVTQPEAAEAWLARDVPFAIVKMNGPEGVSMELTGHGTDAQSSISEMPQNPPGGR